MKFEIKQILKKISYVLSLTIVVMAIGLVGCGDDDKPGPKPDPKSAKNSLSVFSIKGLSTKFAVDLTKKTITNAVALPFGTDVTKLVAVFTAPKGATVTVGSKKQESGKTVNDFSKPVTYTVTAEDGKTKANFVVTVNVAKTAWKKIAEKAFISMKRPSAFAHNDKLWLVGATEVGGTWNKPGKYYEYVYSSTDGKTWNKVHGSTAGKNDSIPLGIFAATTLFKGKLLNIGGIGASKATGKPWPKVKKLPLGISTSSDGKKWTSKALKDSKLPEKGIFNPHAVVKNGELYILGHQPIIFGAVQAIGKFTTYKSTNGTTWTKLGNEVLKTIKTTPAPPTLYASTVFKDEFYVAGGVSRVYFLTSTLKSYSKSVYKSKDGKTWSVVTADGFPTLAGSQIVTYKGKLYAIAGATAVEGQKKAVYTRDVYVSADGKKWDKITGGLALPEDFEPRAFHRVVVFNDKIYIIGGEKGDHGKEIVINEVWEGSFVN